MQKKRPNWDEYFYNIAEVVGTRASCPRASVGAVIVSSDNRILATGYNGAPSGKPHCLDEGCIIEDNHCQRVLHAEVNAVAFAARAGVSLAGARIYVSGLPPCRECSKVLVAAGVLYGFDQEPEERTTEKEAPISYTWQGFGAHS